MTEEAIHRQWETMSAVEAIEAMRDGLVPRWPQDELIGLWTTAARPGMVELRWEPTPQACNPEGVAHGGYIAMALDNACCLAAASLGERLVPQLTLSLNIDYLRAIAPGDGYAVRAEVVHPGKRRLVVNGSITDPGGRTAAQAHAAVAPNRAFADGPPPLPS